MLSVERLRKSFGTRTLFHQVSFRLPKGTRTALVGENGVGKSTLLKMIAGMEMPDRGVITVGKGMLVGYLPQETRAEGKESAREFLLRAVGINALEEKMKVLEGRLDQSEVLEKYETLQEQFERLGGYAFLDRAKGVLDGLALGKLDLHRQLSTFSGGEKRKLALAAVLLSGVDLLLLDEPTNNLDLLALLWLEAYLVRSQATVLVASHDRTFLDHVVTRVLAVDSVKHKVELYHGNWSVYSETTAHRFRRAKELYLAEVRERERVVASAEEKLRWAQETKGKISRDRDKLAANFKKERAIKKFTGSAKALEGRLVRLKKYEKPFERPPLEFKLISDLSTAPPAILASRLSVGYEKKHPVLRSVSLNLPFGARAAFLGENGAGKSTLLKTLQGILLPLSGNIRLGKGAIFGDLLQEGEQLDGSLSAFQYFEKRFHLTDQEKILLLLSRFGFVPEEALVKIARLSPGERIRLTLATLVYQGANILLLDEPTNHLDLEAIQALEDALRAYTGTLLLVTHDRSFLASVPLDHFFLIKTGKVVSLASSEEYESGLQQEAKRRFKRLEERFGRVPR